MSWASSRVRIARSAFRRRPWARSACFADPDSRGAPAARKPADAAGAESRLSRRRLRAARRSTGPRRFYERNRNITNPRTTNARLHRRGGECGSGCGTRHSTLLCRKGRARGSGACAPRVLRDASLPTATNDPSMSRGVIVAVRSRGGGLTRSARRWCVARRAAPSARQPAEPANRAPSGRRLRDET